MNIVKVIIRPATDLSSSILKVTLGHPVVILMSSSRHKKAVFCGSLFDLWSKISNDNLLNFLLETMTNKREEKIGEHWVPGMTHLKQAEKRTKRWSRVSSSAQVGCGLAAVYLDTRTFASNRTTNPKTSMCLRISSTF